MSASRRRWLRVLMVAVLAALLVAFGRHVDWRAASAAARGADFGLLMLALVINQLSLAFKAVRWWVFLRPLGVHSLWLVARATLAGASLNNLVVAQGGEAARVVLVSRATGVSSARVAAGLALERILDAVSYLVLLVSAAWMLTLPGTLLRWRTAASVALAVVVGALVALGMSSRGSEEQIPRLGLGTAIWQRSRSYLHRFASSANELASPMRLSVAMLLSLAAWALQVATYHLVALATHLPISLSGTIAAMLAVGISFLIRATPGNVGVFQVIYAMTARGFGIAESPAVATALLIQTIQVLPTIAIGTLMSHGLMKGAPAEERIAKLSRPL